MSSRYVNATKYQNLNIQDGYKIVPAIDPRWRDTEMRLAIVLESIDRDDLYHKSLYIRDDGTSSATSISIRHVLKYAKAFSQKVTGEAYDFALAIINWNAAKTYGLDPKAVHSYNSTFSARVHYVLDDLKPTHVLVMGDIASSALMPTIQNLNFKRGWVFKKNNTLWTSTLNVEQLVSSKGSEDDSSDDVIDGDYNNSDGEKDKDADLLYHVARNISNLIAGKLLFSAKGVQPNPVYINTIEKFNRLYEKLLSADKIALDSETKSLESIANAIYFIQFAFSSERGYVVPLDHPRTPFSSKERGYIKKKLREFFGERHPDKIKVFVTIGGSFDFRVLRAQLGIRVIHHKVHEITGGENLIDENSGIFTRVKMRGGKLESKENLQSIFAVYGNDWYFTAPFSKSERTTTGMHDPDSKDVLNYASMDVQSIFAISELQPKVAEALSIYDYALNKKVPYKKHFMTHLINQMGTTTLSISTLEQNGSHVDVPYMLKLLGEKSPLKESLTQTLERFKKLPTIQKANQIIAKREGGGTASPLFGKNPFVIKLAKPSHKIAIFIEVMGLKPLAFTKTKQPQIDKFFNAKYAKQYVEVDLYSEFQVITKLLTTYVRGWINQLFLSLDSKKDHRFRARYSFFRIVTGRLLSFKPNLQQIPSRGSKSKVIKRMFVAPKGYIQMRADYSAHEVRFWAITGKDKVLASAFKTALELKASLIQLMPGKKRDVVYDELKKKGDVHIQNVYIFYSMWVDKNHEYRDSIKRTVFGLIYGKSVNNLAQELYESYINRLKTTAETLVSRVEKAKKIDGDKKDPSPEDIKILEDKKNLRTLIKEANQAVEDANNPEKTIEGYREEAKNITDRVFSRFSKGKQYLDDMSERILKDGWVNGPTGRRRNIFRVFTGRRSAQSAAVRAAKNSPIQGFASEVGLRAGYIALIEADLFMVEFEDFFDKDDFVLYSRTVHDANYYEIPYQMYVPFLWIYQHASMILVKEAFERDFGYKWLVQPEVEIELSTREDKSYRWDWTLDNLRLITEKVLEDQVGIGYLNKEDKQAALETVLRPAKEKRIMNYLQRNYPLLGQKLNPEVIDLLIHK